MQVAIKAIKCDCRGPKGYVKDGRCWKASQPCNSHCHAKGGKTTCLNVEETKEEEEEGDD
jgi:hypothetical protein